MFVREIVHYHPYSAIAMCNVGLVMICQRAEYNMKNYGYISVTVDIIHFVFVYCQKMVLLLTWLDFNPVWITNYIHYKVWNWITFPFPGFNGCIAEVWNG